MPVHIKVFLATAKALGRTDSEVTISVLDTYQADARSSQQLSLIIIKPRRPFSTFHEIAYPSMIASAAKGCAARKITQYCPDPPKRVRDAKAFQNTYSQTCTHNASLL